MEELQNLRSDSEALEKQMKAPLTFSIFKVLAKTAVAVLTCIGEVTGNDCGAQMNDLVLGTSIIMVCEAVFGSLFLIVKYQNEKCVKAAGFILIFAMIFDLLYSMLYVGWGIYITIIYFNENECGHDFSFTDVVGLVDVVYFLVALSIMACCCGAKVCICFSTLLATAKSNVDRSLSHDLVNVRRESFVE